MKNLNTMLFATAIMAALSVGCKNANDPANDTYEETRADESTYTGMDQQQDNTAVPVDTMATPGNNPTDGESTTGQTGQGSGSTASDSESSRSK